MKHSPLSTVARLAIAAGLGALACLPIHAQIFSPGFESGLTGWSESGGAGNVTTPTSYTGAYTTIAPATGSHFGLISNSGVLTETLSQTFTLASNARSLSLSYRFLTDEYNDPAFNPSATGILTPSVGAPITLFTVSRNDLQAGGAGNLLPGASYLDVQTIGHSAWQTSSTDITALAGQSVTLSFVVNNDGDTEFLLDSQLAVDSVQVSPVPEPSEYGVFFGSALAGLAVWMRRSRKP